MVNVWHDVPVGKKAPEIVNAIIEIPKDSQIKYEIDKDTGLLMLDRYLYSAMHYPGDYGLVPQTLWDDGDPLDILVFTGRPTYPMTLCECRVIGVLRMVDGEEKDDKILAIHHGDPRFAEWKDVKDIPQHLIKELHNFMERYKELEGKTVKVFEVLGRDAAFKDIEKAQKLYQDKFGKK